MVDLLDLGLALKVLASNKLGNVVLVTILALVALLHALIALGQLAQGGQGVGAELVEDAGDEFGQLLILASAIDSEGVCGDGSVNLRRGKVNDVAVALEHVDLLDSLDGLDVELLESLLELLVVGTGSLGCALHLPARGALAADARRSTELLEALLDVGHVDGVGTGRKTGTRR